MARKRTANFGLLLTIAAGGWYFYKQMKAAKAAKALAAAGMTGTSTTVASH